ncbi:hypothetical protein BT63DRAFT_152609 [Microthyrium microscopicum]|uniref:GPI anchored cell wall protein n=1 Tax=Microthyrium microscopicum TaxID=703497 RepID=A0A6A6UQB5_9PEZI|nr:hypothetical protein BT63DRAFT_152609 [Microthyrium microscopicum]
MLFNTLLTSSAILLAVSAESSSSSKTKHTTQLSFYIPGLDPQALVGSVLAADSTATTINVACPTGVDSSACGLGGATAVLTKMLPANPTGKTTYAGSFTLDKPAMTSIFACRLRETGSAKCDRTRITAGATAAETGLPQASPSLETITVTGGLKKLRAAASGTEAGSATPSAGKKDAASSSAASSTGKSNAKPTAAPGGVLVAGLIGVAALAL